MVEVPEKSIPHLMWDLANRARKAGSHVVRFQYGNRRPDVVVAVVAVKPGHPADEVFDYLSKMVSGSFHTRVERRNNDEEDDGA